MDTSIALTDTSVNERLAYLWSRRINTSRGGVDINETRKFKNTRDSLRNDNAALDTLQALVMTTLQKEDIIERALQNANNIKRISTNNVDDAGSQRELRNKYLVEWHRKFTLAASCILLFFIGAPLGAIIKKGGFGLPLVISILLFILYYVIGIFGEKLVFQGTLPAALGMWLSMLILLPLAIFLTYKASRDSQLFDADAYKRVLRKITPKWAKGGMLDVDK